MVAELSRRQQHLTDIIKNKDLQIEDYKAEGIKLMRSIRFFYCSTVIANFEDKIRLK